MSQASTDCQWGILGHSQKGSSHVRQDLTNQDAIEHDLAADGAPPVILAVADGHGSPKSFRSHMGARLAVETAVEVCREFLDSMKGADPSAVKAQAELRVPPRIFQRWRQRVEEDFGQNPFTDAELSRLAEQAGQAARERAVRPEQLSLAYGSTLLVAVVDKEFLLCFQLGDGDILAVSDAGVVERAVPKDKTLIANETTSLCQEDGKQYMRPQFRLFQDALPAMVLLSTDGYCNSFATPDAFLKVGADYLDMLRAEGPEEIEKGLPAWLEDTSRNGSGDDITVGIIYRRQPPLGKPEGQQVEAESPAAGASAEHAGETRAAGNVAEESAGSALPVSENPAGDAGERLSPGLVSAIFHPFTFFSSKHGGKPGGTKS
jgi:serine/threonine protein phosphatase PrpC